MCTPSARPPAPRCSPGGTPGPWAGRRPQAYRSYCSMVQAEGSHREVPADRTGGRRGHPASDAQGLVCTKSSRDLHPSFQGAGYKTHVVGKWHLGYCDTPYLPTRYLSPVTDHSSHITLPRRGFDSFFGLLQQSTHYRSR